MSTPAPAYYASSSPAFGHYAFWLSPKDKAAGNPPVRVPSGVEAKCTGHGHSAVPFEGTLATASVNSFTVAFSFGKVIVHGFGRRDSSASMNDLVWSDSLRRIGR